MYRMYEPREAGRQMARTASFSQCQATTFNSRPLNPLLNPLIIALIISLICVINLLLVLSPLGL